jgi:hypothetical protein
MYRVTVDYNHLLPLFPDLETNVADPGCLSRIPDPGSRILIFTHPGSRIPDPGFRIPDPGSKNSTKRER